MMTPTGHIAPYLTSPFVLCPVYFSVSLFQNLCLKNIKFTVSHNDTYMTPHLTSSCTLSNKPRAKRVPMISIPLCRFSLLHSWLIQATQTLYTYWTLWTHLSTKATHTGKLYSHKEYEWFVTTLHVGSHTLCISTSVVFFASCIWTFPCNRHILDSAGINMNINKYCRV